MSLHKIIAALFVLIAAVSTESKQHPEISNDADGGQVAEEGQFPFMVSVQYNKTHYCGGSIIDSDKILTSASCLEKMARKQNMTLKNLQNDMSKLRVVAGTINWNATSWIPNANSTGVEMVVQKMDYPPQYNAALNGSDIAILSLKSKLNSSENVQLIPLQNDAVLSQVLNEDVLIAYFAGWGKNKTNNYDQLHWGTPRTLPGCIKGGKQCPAPNNSFCALWTGNGSVSDGDLGGPLFISFSTNSAMYQQLGILSYKDSDGVLVFADVAKNADWIAQVIGSNAAPNQMSIFVHIFTIVFACFLI